MSGVYEKYTCINRLDAREAGGMVQMRSLTFLLELFRISFLKATISYRPVYSGALLFLEMNVLIAYYNENQIRLARFHDEAH